MGTVRDLVAGLALSLPLLAWFLVMPNRLLESRAGRLLTGTGLFLLWSGIAFAFMAEFFFFEQLRSRFNALAIEYLLYPNEILANLWYAYPVTAVIVASIVLGEVWLIASLILFRTESMAPVPFGGRLAWFVVPLLVVMVSGRMLQMNRVQLVSDRTLGQMADNTFLSLQAAVRSRSLEYPAFYPTMPRDDAFQRARRLVGGRGATFDGEPHSIRRQIPGSLREPRLNVILILEESLGTRWGNLDGRQSDSLTPQIDDLAREAGLLFTNLTATGDQTTRGLEAILASFPPLAGEAIVTRDQSENVETLARVLRRDGYRNLFVYGGRGAVDGLRDFVLQNGYHRLVDRADFPRPAHTSLWGVNHADLYDRVLEESRQASGSGQPFFITCLSVPDHDPFWRLRRRFQKAPTERQHANAIKYADFALGQFFLEARREPFWTNTIFVVVNGRAPRLDRPEIFPIAGYQVPMLIAGPAVVKEPARISYPGSTLDVAPTILGLLGRPYDSLFFGRDLLKRNEGASWTLLLHDRDLALFSGDHLVKLGLRNYVEHWVGNPRVGAMTRMNEPGEKAREQERDAIALFQTADDLYRNRQYRIDRE